jgi:hypothetical protein
MSVDPKAFEPVFRQNWENARHIKSERIWFMNIFSVISAGALRVAATFAALVYVRLFSLIGLLISLRLKVELEECLGKLQALFTFVEPQRASRLQLYGKPDNKNDRRTATQNPAAILSVCQTAYLSLITWTIGKIALSR